MFLKQLEITGIRNLATTKLYFSPGMNVFYGANGSGKTSLLEAIYVLGLGRSFRAANLQQIININQEKYIISGVIGDNIAINSTYSCRIGTEKAKNNAKALFRKDGELCFVSYIAKIVPLLLLNSASLELLLGGPIWRRAFVDFALFHVEHSFLTIFQQFKRCLAQRNAVLKSADSILQKRKQLEPWNEAFCHYGELITAFRIRFLTDFAKIFTNLIADWQCCSNIFLQYKQGWADTVLLKDVLTESLQVDLLSGCTNKGPHRAEIEIFVDGAPAKGMLSRGQQKVFVCGMLLAKAAFLQKKSNISSIFLVDDLNSELDEDSFSFIVDKLVASKGQIFITGIDKGPLTYCFTKKNSALAGKMFHVEHSGEIIENAESCRES